MPPPPRKQNFQRAGNTCSLAHPAHGVLVRGGEPARPAADVLEKHAFVVPRNRRFGFHERNETKSLQLGRNFGRSPTG